MEKKSQAKVLCEFGHEKGPSLLQTLCLVFTSVVAVVSLVSMVAIWKSGLIDDMISQNLVIERNSHVYDVWVKPPVKPVVNIYLFNYTNVAKFAAGREKLRVQEVGPYAYRMSFEKVRVQFRANNTVSFQEKKFYHFLPLHSKGSLDDVINVPSIALLGAVHNMNDRATFLQYPVAQLANGLSATPFKQLRVGELLWGYDDSLFNMAKPLLNLVKDVPDKLGLLVGKNGSTGEERFTIFTGEDDISKLGIVTEYNGKPRLSMWQGDECNRVDGSEGSMFPPPQVAQGQRLFIFMPQLCRRLPFDAERRALTNGMPAVRYTPPEEVFDNSRPDTRCFCPKGRCPPKGIFDVGACTFDGPFVASFPHFYLGDPELVSTLDGLSPSQDKHQFYIDIHGKFGVPLGGKSRLQINIMARKNRVFQAMGMFKQDTILPLVWFEVSVDDLPPEVKSDLKLATHTATHGLMYFLLLMFVVSSVVIAYHATKVTRLKEPIVPVHTVRCGRPSLHPRI